MCRWCPYLLIILYLDRNRHKRQAKMFREEYLRKDRLAITTKATNKI